MRNHIYPAEEFTNLNNLARNLEIRRKKGDRRGVFAFKQFSERYIECKKNDLQKIEIINRRDFYKILVKYFKYEFKNKEDLIKFSNDIFSNMDIKDDNIEIIKVSYDLYEGTGDKKTKIGVQDCYYATYKDGKKHGLYQEWYCGIDYKGKEHREDKLPEKDIRIPQKKNLLYSNQSLFYLNRC